MKLVIEIPKAEYKKVKEGRASVSMMRKAIRNSAPLQIGHWIPTGAYYTGAYGNIDYVECSCCHYESLEEGYFCPNCGANMDDDNNDN